MRSADGRYWMVFNGEIYNYVELGAELLEQGVVLRSSCDSEVLLETYARVGKDVVHKLRGMYAFAIWDSWTRELFCARDQFGIKPFYYRLDPEPAARPGWRSGGLHAARPAPTTAGDIRPAFPAGEPDDWSAPNRRPGGGTRPPAAAGPRRPTPADRRLPAGHRSRRRPGQAGPSGCCGSPPSARPSPTRASCGRSTTTRCAGTCPSSTSRRRAP